MLSDLHTVWHAGLLGRALLALATAAPVIAWLTYDLFRQLRDDLRLAHDRLNNFRATDARLFRRKPDHIEAFQVGANDVPAWGQRFASATAIDAGGELVALDRGDWLALDAGGNVFPIKAAKFAADYERAR